MSMGDLLNIRGSTASDPIIISDDPDQLQASPLSSMPTEIKVRILQYVLDPQCGPQHNNDREIHCSSMNPDLADRPGYITICFHYGHAFRSVPNLNGISGVFRASRIWQSLGYELLYKKNIFTFLGSTMTGRPGSISKQTGQTVLQQWSFSPFISPLISELRIGLSDDYSPFLDPYLPSTLTRFPRLRKLTFDLWNGWDSWGPRSYLLMTCCEFYLDFLWCIEVDVPDVEGHERVVASFKNRLEQRNRQRQARNHAPRVADIWRANGCIQPVHLKQSGFDQGFV